MFGNFYHLEHFSLVIWGFLTHVIDSLSFERSFKTNNTMYRTSPIFTADQFLHLKQVLGNFFTYWVKLPPLPIPILKNYANYRNKRSWIMSKGAVYKQFN